MSLFSNGNELKSREYCEHSVVIQAQQTEFDRANTLMELLARGNDTYLPQFYDALMVTNQRHVVHLMNFKGWFLSNM